MVGITSFIFHSTLSIGGQIMDESSIIMFIITSDLTLNNNYYNSIIFSILLLLSLYIPHYCRFILLGCGFFIIYNTHQNIKNKYKSVVPYFINNLYLLIIGVFFWILEMLICDSLVFATHFIFHIMTSIALHNLIILTIIINNNQVALDNDILFFTLKEKKPNSPFNKIL
tara:strand:+ start:1139 stop:1648 length:510 start_codon:yes stop_codon:yes gene_type:complete